MSARNGREPHPSRREMFGKTVVITGASSGIGLASAEALAGKGARIVMVCRNPARAEEAKARVELAATGPRPSVVLADFSDQAQIREAAADLHRSVDSIDVLINNAGSIFAKRELTVDGVERTFAVNHLAPFLLTKLLTDLLSAARFARVVTVVSEIYSKRIDFDNLQGERHYQFFRAYQASKLANILFTNEFARRVADSQITANSVSPGPTVTRFGDELAGLPAVMPKAMKRIPFLFKSPDVGARGVVRLASDRDVAGMTGRFFMRLKEEQLKPVALDAENAKRLWRVSAELTALAPALASADTLPSV